MTPRRTMLGLAVALGATSLLACVAGTDGASPPPGTGEADPGDLARADGFGGSGPPALVAEFLSSFRSWIDGRAYRLGGSCVGNSAGDCSSCPTTVLRNMGLGVVGTQADLDHANFVACHAGDFRPGDLVLIGYSCGAPDHWIVLSTVNDPGNAVSTANRIVDQSSDCAPYCGEGPMRPNLARRAVCACARHRAFVSAWSGASASESSPEGSEDAPPDDDGGGGPDDAWACDGKCAANRYDACTCSSLDPCGWAGDGYCDELCALYFADVFDDSADCER